MSKIALRISAVLRCVTQPFLNGLRKMYRQLQCCLSTAEQRQDDERTGRNGCLLQDAGAGVSGNPHEPNSAHGNRNQKLCEAVRKTSSLASAAGELANVSEQLASEFEKEIGNMNVFIALKKAINLEGISQSRVKELSMPGRKKGNSPWNH